MAINLASTPISRHFRVEVLGPFALYRDGAPVDTSKWQRRVETLFKLLITGTGHRRLRDEIIDIIWPDAAPDAAAGNLRVVVHRLRAALGGGDPSPVISEGGWVMLNPEYEWDIDLDRFEALVESAGSVRVGEAAPLLEAAQLVQGEVLAEDRYDDWATPVRDHVRRTRRELYLQLAVIYQARAEYDAAAHWLERALDDDPYDEEALRGLLTVLALAGKPADAIRRYQRFVQRLREEVDVSPSAETESLAARIREGGDLPAGGGLPDLDRLPSGGFLGAIPLSPLVGRQEELERVQFTIDLVESGAGRLVVIGGEAGIGKTRFAQEISMRLRERGFLVATGRCYERDREVPLYPFIDVLAVAQAAAPPEIRAGWPELSQLPRTGLPAGHRQSPASGYRQSPASGWHIPGLTLAIAGFLVGLAARGPVAVLLDDLHWADEASVNLLGELARRTRGHRVLLLATYREAEADRDGPLAHALLELSREGLVERLSLSRLSLEATGALVAQTMGELTEPEELAAYVYRRTRGNPYYVERMLTALAGRYRLLREVGAGGMGHVFEAVDTRYRGSDAVRGPGALGAEGRRVAVKLMFARTEADPRALRRFEQEAETLAALKHPNIVQVYDHLVDEHSGCIVMELVPGQPLSRLLRSGPMPLETARDIAGQVAAALAFAHEHGIVHRDIKPDNIMVADDGSVKVTDFGIARMARSPAATTLTSKGLTMGTPLYMAPEQIEGQRVDGRSDVYSLGAVLYAMTTGTPPFVSEDPIAIAYKQVHEVPVTPSDRNAALPPDWDALMLTALAKDPAQRFPDATALREAILRLSPIEGQTIPLGQADTSPLPVSPSAAGVHVERQPRRARVGRLTLLAGTVGGAMVLAAAGVLAARALAPHSSAAPATRPHPVAARNTIPLTWGRAGTARGQFEGPAGATTDSHGDLWVADNANDRVEEFSPRGKFLAAVGSLGTGNGQFQGPTDVAVSPEGFVYVADPTNGRIEKFSPHLRWLANFQFIPQGSGAPTALSSISTDAQGNVYAADYSKNHIRVFSPSGVLLRSWGLKGTGPKRFNSPDGIAVDSVNRVVYVADKFNYRIQKFSLDGTSLTMWGSRGSSHGQFDRPADVAIGPDGNVYVADTFNYRVQEFTPSGRFLHAWGTDGSGYMQFHRPSGVAVDSRGVIYVTDYYNNRVERILPAASSRNAQRP